MVQIIITPNAESDLDNIRKFISEDSIFHAQKFVNQSAFEALLIRKAPEGGGIVKEFANPNIRQRLFKKYRIIYLLKKHRIEILTFHHSAMLLQNNPHLKDYLK